MITNRQLFLNHLAKTSDLPLMIEIESAEGIYMYGPENKKYIDLISGIGVSNLGHCHPSVVRAIKKQADLYMHVMVYGEFIQSPQVQLAKAIADTLPEGLDHVYFVNSGSEAVEGALKLAKRHTGRSQIVSCFNAYHGSTHGALSVCGNEDFKQAYRPLLPGIEHIRYGNIQDLAHLTEEVAAIIIETVQGEAGVQCADHTYFKALREKCDQNGVMLILDEVQTGFGRTGKFWAFENYDVRPDILVAAKGMGGGMPIGAFVANEKVMAVLKSDPILGHITTFGGHPVNAAASLATLETIQEHKLFESAERKAELFKSLLKHKKIRQIRNKGLLMAVAFDSFDTLKPIIDRAIELGVMTDWFLYCDDSMRIAPPLIITEEQITEACQIIIRAINDCS